jgi:hypothetical protein
MVRNLLLGLVAAVLVFGCGTVFTHPTKNQENLSREFERDRKDCERYVANNPFDPNATCKVAASTMTEGSAGGLYNAVLPADDGTCATCEEVMRCLVEQKGWKKAR